MVERIKEAINLNSILYIYSQSDKWTPVSMGERFQQNTPVPAELWTVEDAEHALIIKSAHAEEYKSKILSFFNKAVEEALAITEVSL